MSWPPPKPVLEKSHGHFTATEIYQDQIDKWYAEHIEALGKGSVVHGNFHDSSWTREQGVHDTHKAILIGIERMTEETAEVVLRELVEELKSHVLPSHSAVLAVIKKAKMFLAKQNAGK